MKIKKQNEETKTDEKVVKEHEEITEETADKKQNEETKIDEKEIKENEEIKEEGETKKENEVKEETGDQNAIPSPPLDFPPPPPPSLKTSSSSLPTSRFKKAKVHTKNLNWSKISINEIKHTVYNKLGVIEIDFWDEIEIPFASKPALVKKESKVKVVKIIPDQKSQNIEMFLKNNKMKSEEIKKAVIQLDGKFLNDLTLKFLIDNCPTAEEIATLHEYLEKEPDHTKLRISEQFIFELSSIPNLKERLEAVRFQMQFNIELNDIRRSIESLKNATSQVKNSDKFAKVMEIILNVGNFLNSSRANAQAIGFKLNSLLILSDLKTVDNKSNLLEFLVEKIYFKFPDLVSFEKELSSVKRVCNNPTQTDLEKQMLGLSKKLAVIGGSIKDIERMNETEIFHDKLNKFFQDAAVEQKKNH